MHLDTVSRSYWPGLFHCYDVPGLPRTNNELESHFRETRRRLLRTTGQTGANAADAATPGRLGTPAPAPDRGQVTGGLASNPPRGLGAGAAAFCCASPAVPLAESFPETDPSAIRSTASAVVSTTSLQAQGDFCGIAFQALLPLARTWAEAQAAEGAHSGITLTITCLR